LENQTKSSLKKEVFKNGKTMFFAQKPRTRHWIIPPKRNVLYKPFLHVQFQQLIIMLIYVKGATSINKIYKNWPIKFGSRHRASGDLTNCYMLLFSELVQTVIWCYGEKDDSMIGSIDERVNRW
jgi:hypothetical protein